MAIVFIFKVVKLNRQKYLPQNVMKKCFFFNYKIKNKVHLEAIKRVPQVI